MSNLLQQALASALRSRSTCAAMLLLGASVLPAAAQSTCTITVSSTADSGTGSLRDAITNAATGSTICVTATGTITLQSQLSINPGLTITGPGATSLTLSGNNVLLPASDSSTAPITISNLTIANSTSAGITVGGGVAATLSAVVVSGNQASGINNSGDLTILNSTITNNTTSQAPGAGIYNQTGGTLTLTNCIVSSNNSGYYTGGGLENDGTATITGGTFLANTGQQGAAINSGIVSSDQGAVLTLTGGTNFLQNSAVGYGGGGAVFNEYNYENSGEGANVANITGATFSGNTTRAQSSGGTEGGAINNGGQMTVRESTFYSNTADGPGGAIYNSGTLTLVQDTVTANTSTSIGSGLSQEESSESQTLFLTNTIISGNTTDDCDNCGTIPGGNLVGGSAMLGPLANNGASATNSPQTIMPLPGSAAIAGGVGPDNGTDATDERGLSRTTMTNGTLTIDIGAVQTHYKSVTFLVQPPSPVLEGATFTPPVEVQVTEQDGNTLNYPTGVPVTLSLLQNGSTPSGATLSGTLTGTPVTDSQGRVAAVFSDLSVATPGTYTLQGTTYPTQPAGTSAPAYNGTSSAFTVTAPTPTTVSWSPASLVYGTALPSTELNATVSINGATPTACGSACTYTFTAGGNVTAGAIYGAASYPVQVTYTAPDSTTATATATLIITQATPALTLITPPAVLPGAVLTMANLHANALGVNGAPLPGTVAYSSRLGSPVSNGDYTVTFTPSDTTDYVATTASATLTVASKEATSTTLTATPNPVLPGTSVVLNASVAPAAGSDGVVPGTLAFSDPTGLIASKPLALDQANANFQAGAIQAFAGQNDYSTYSADFNGDGIADLLIVPSYGALGLELSQVGAIPALGAPVSIANFGTACSNGSGTPTSAFSFAVGDANGDGLPDIAIACNNFDSTTTSLVLLVNQGAGTFTPSTITTLQNEYAAQIVFGDFNGDGKQDLVLLTGCAIQTSGDASPCLNYMVGNGDGTFASPVVEELNNGSTYDSFANLLTGDFNKDGQLDIAFIYYPYRDSDFQVGVVDVWKNNGGSFGTVVGDGNCSSGTCYTADATIAAGSGGTLSSLVTADFNVDGLPDLALVTTANESGSQSTRSVALNTSTAGAISFPQATTDVQTGSGLASLVAADFDDDGIPDLALYNSSDNTVRVLHGAGDGTFSFIEPNLLFTLPAPGNIEEDVRTPSPARASARRRGARNAAVRPSTSYYSGMAYPLLAVGDANGDGTPDLLIGIPAVDQSGNVTGNVNGQQYVVSGGSLAATTITAPAAQTTYTATAAPSVLYWAASSGTATLGLTSVGTQTSLTVSPMAPVYGQPLTLSAQVLNVTGTPAVNGSVSFLEDGSTTPLATVAINASGIASYTGVMPTAGAHSFIASYGGATGESPSSSSTSSVTVARAVPALTWTPAAINSTTPLGAAQLDAAAAGVTGATLNGTFVYTPAAGTTLSAGTHTLSVTFTPADATDYTTATTTVQIQVASTTTQTSLAISPSAPYTYGQALTLSASVTNTGSSTVVQGGTVTFTATNSTAALPSVTVVNGTASLAGVVLPAGTHVIGATYTGASGEGNSSATAQTITIAQVAPVLTWSTPAAITTTTPLSATQLDAAAAGVGGATLPGTFVYTPAAGTLLSAGTHTLSATFTPTDTVDYTSGSTTAQISVTNTNTQTTLSITPPGPYTYGTPLTLSAAVTNTTGTTVVQGGTVAFTSGTATLASVTVVNGVASLAGQVLPAGTHVIGATYTGGSGEGNSGALAQTIVIAQFTPTITWATPAGISTTTPLGGNQLDAAAKGLPGATLDLAGTFTYTPAAGTLLSAGSHTLSVLFTPADAVNYSTATDSVMIQVSATGTQTTLALSPASSTYGQPLTLTAHVTNLTPPNAVVNTGTVTFTNGTTTLGTPVAVSNGVAILQGVILAAGQPIITASYSGTAAESSSSASATATIARATSVLTWPAPPTISSTTPLSALELNATAAGAGTTGPLPGTFTYTPAAGTTLSVGSHTLSVSFTPKDAVDYTVATAQVTISVIATNTSTTLTVTPAQITYGQTVALAAAVKNTTGTAIIQTGSVVFAADNVTLATVSVVNGAASLTGVLLSGGTHSLTASYTGADGEGISGGAKSITVAKVTPTLAWATPAQITTTTPLTGTQLDASATGLNNATLPGTFVYTPAAGTLLTAGARTLAVTFTPTDITDYATATAQVTIQVVAETITLTTISPTTTTIGTTALPVTLTGSGFPASAVIRMNGTTLPTTVVSPTQLGATIPAATLAKAGSLSFTIYDPSSQATSNALVLTVTAPTPAVVVTAPATVVSGAQPSITLALTQAYPVEIDGVSTLTFTPAGPNGVHDPAVQFVSGGSTYTFKINAGDTAGPTELLQVGTVEGTVSVDTVLTAGGANVTPPDLTTPTAISIAASVPTITGVTFTNVNGLLTVVVSGYSNTREMTQGEFVFTGPGEADLATPAVILPATGLFGTWYSNPDSDDFGSTFVYTQTFQLSNTTTNITGVTVTLSNTVGPSASVNSQ